MQVLVKTNVTKYLEFKAVDGSFVVNAGKVEKVPATAMEALKSPLMGFFEKRRAAKFFRCILNSRGVPHQPMHCCGPETMRLLISPSRDHAS